MNKDIVNMLFDLAVDHESDLCANLSAAVVKRNKILSFGFNQKKTHPFQALWGKNEESIYWHAETQAIHNAIKRHGEEKIHGADLYVTRAKKESPRGKYIYGMACPCEGCMNAIKYYGIKNVYFTAAEEEIGVISKVE